MARFEVEDVYISDVLLNTSDYTPRRKLNIQVELKFEAQQNLLASDPTPEQLAKELGDAITQAFSKTNVYVGGGMAMDKKEIVIRPATSDKYGWYELNAYNQKLAEEYERAHREWAASKGIVVSE